MGARDNLNANLLSLPGTGPHFLSHPPCSLVIIMTELAWVLTEIQYHNYGNNIVTFIVCDTKLMQYT